MYTLTPTQTHAIYLLKINEVEMCEDLSDRDKEIIKNFYKSKISKLNKLQTS